MEETKVKHEEGEGQRESERGEEVEKEEKVCSFGATHANGDLTHILERHANPADRVHRAGNKGRVDVIRAQSRGRLQYHSRVDVDVRVGSSVGPGQNSPYNRIRDYSGLDNQCLAQAGRDVEVEISVCVVFCRGARGDRKC